MEERNHKPSQSAKAVRKTTIEQSKSKDMRKKEKTKKEVKAKSKTETGNKKQEHSLAPKTTDKLPCLSHPIQFLSRRRQGKQGSGR
jgi:hypothetical protein